MSFAIRLAESGWVPDPVLRFAMRKRMAERLSSEAARDKSAWLASLHDGPVAIDTSAANEQHYEVPAEFFQRSLGPHLKYSCSLWSDEAQSLEQAEAAMLQVSSERAGLVDGQSILELGCGWGSWSLWMAEHYPSSRIVSVSNSHSQKQFIDDQASKRNLDNLTVVTANMRSFSIDEQFDRVVSIEMFEHMRNYAELLRRISNWLVPDGRLFVHIFCHDKYCYPFEVDGGKDWMAKHFFTGGLMPSFDIFDHFPGAMQLEESWRVNGTHYEKTANAWLALLDKNRDYALSVLRSDSESAATLLQRWRMFYMACAELFGFNSGKEWYVGHYRLKKT